MNSDKPPERQRLPLAILIPIFLPLLVATFLALQRSCGRTVEAPAREQSTQNSHTGPSSVVTTSEERIISFAPHITETIFALGKGDQVVAVSDFCDFPPAVENLERVGGWHNPDLEKVTMLNPDILIVQGEHEKVTELAKKRGFELFRVDMDSLETIRAGIRAIGGRLGCSEAAEQLVQEFDGDLAAVRESVSAKPRTKALILTGRQLHDMANFHTVGGASFVSELVTVAGGDNIYAEAGRPYIEASKETVVMRAPEAVVEFHAGETLSDDIKTQYIADWQQLPSLPAVQNNRIFLVTESHALRPGPRVPEMAAQVASLLYPDVDIKLGNYGQTP
jgi:iron complex transport system substrate-binding protein